MKILVFKKNFEKANKENWILPFKMKNLNKLGVFNRRNIFYHLTKTK